MAPIYEYECVPCKRTIEMTFKMNENPVVACKKCKKEMKHIISKIGGFVLKGKGFYCNDYPKR
jgi:putative FmdB family regulatory protein